MLPSRPCPPGSTSSPSKHGLDRLAVDRDVYVARDPNGHLLTDDVNARLTLWRRVGRHRHRVGSLHDALNLLQEFVGNLHPVPVELVAVDRAEMVAALAQGACGDHGAEHRA